MLDCKYACILLENIALDAKPGALLEFIRAQKFSFQISFPHLSIAVHTCRSPVGPPWRRTAGAILPATWSLPRRGICQCRDKPERLSGEVIGIDLKTIVPVNGAKWKLLLACDFTSGKARSTQYR